jgi:hypothetical protein
MQGVQRADAQWGKRGANPCICKLPHVSSLLLAQARFQVVSDAPSEVVGNRARSGMPCEDRLVHEARGGGASLRLHPCIHQHAHCITYWLMAWDVSEALSQLVNKEASQYMPRGMQASTCRGKRDGGQTLQPGCG